jgi:hypothetical protein
MSLGIVIRRSLLTIHSVLLLQVRAGPNGWSGQPPNQTKAIERF